MIDPKVTDLMNLVLDGTATATERAELEAYLSTSSEARSHYESLSRLVRRLDAQPLIDPPAGLEAHIYDGVEKVARPARSVPAHGFSAWLRAFLAPPKQLKPWATFGLGLAAGVFLFAAVQFGRPDAWKFARDVDPSHVSGTMTHPAGRSPAGSIPVRSEAGAFSGSAVVYATDGGILVDVGLQSTVAIEWELSFDRETWTLKGVERQGTATSAFASNPGSIRGLHTGEGHVKVALTGSGDPMQAVVLKVFQGGEPVFEGTPAPAR